MNPGYLSFLLISIIIILLLSGWRTQLIRNVPHSVIITFIVSWFICSAFHLSLMGPYRVNLCIFLLVGAVFWIALLLKSWIDRIHLMTWGFLLSAVFVLLNQLIYLEPAYIVIHPYVNISLVLGTLCAMFIKHPLNQIAVISVGLIAGDIVNTFVIYKHLPFELGAAHLYDLWWLTFLITRLITEVWDQVWKYSKLVLHFWLKN